MMKNMMKESGQSSGDALDGIPVTLEINPNHSIVRKIAALKNPELSNIAIKQLFDNACISAGMIEDPRLLLGNLNALLEFCLSERSGALEHADAGQPDHTHKSAEISDSDKSEKFEEACPVEKKEAAAAN